MTCDDLAALIRARDPLGLAATLPPPREVTYTRVPPPGDWLVDSATEGSITDHRAAHAAGRPSEAAVRYGEGVAPEEVAERVLALAALARDTGMLRTVCPVPVAGEATPGSWGVEDLTVIAAARRALDPSVRVRPSWERLGAQTCAVALAFGADDLAVPPGDATDAETLIASAGRRAVPR